MRRSWIGWSGLLVLMAQWPCCALAQAPGPEIQQDLQQQQSILADADSSQAQKDEAALRLLSRPGDEARRLITTVLTDVSNPRGQLAAARALASSPTPDPAYIAPLFSLLGTDRALTEAAAMTLATYKDNPEVIRGLANFANSRQQRLPLRVATINAIGTLVDKRGASILMELITRADESADIHNAAADALIQMTGLRENDRDVQRWRQWWAAASERSEREFRNDLLTSRATRFGQLRSQYTQLVQEAEALLSERYRSATPAQQPEILLRYLRSGQPEVRQIGARIVYEDAIAAQPVPAAARERLRGLVGDSSAEVRRDVARALRAINDAAAAPALLTQLKQEPDPDVRSAIIQALAPIGDVVAAPELIHLLDDPYLRTATAAADALESLGPALREKDPALAHETAMKLRQVLEQRTLQPGASGLREAVVQAMAPLQDADLLGTFSRLLKPSEAVGVRRAALKAMGELRLPEAADLVARSLEDPEARVRLQAVDALGKIGSAEHSDALMRRMSSADEPDSSVRQRAWEVLQTFFPALPREQLTAWSERFADDPARRLVVLKSLAAKFQADSDFRQLALVRQQRGLALMKLNQPADAAAAFQQALEYWDAQKVEDMVTESLIEQRMQALLRSRQFAESARFGEQLIARRAAYQQTVGAMIRAEAEQLIRAGELNDALALINEVKRMNPPLALQYREDLSVLEGRVRQQLGSKNKEQGSALQACRKSTQSA